MQFIASSTGAHDLLWGLMAAEVLAASVFNSTREV